MAGDHGDEHVLEETQVSMQITTAIQTHDGVGDKLAGTVVGYVTTAIGSVQRNLFTGKGAGVPDKVPISASTKAQGKDRFVLGEDEGIWSKAFEAGSLQGRLADESIDVSGAAPSFYCDRRHEFRHVLRFWNGTGHEG